VLTLAVVLYRVTSQDEQILQHIGNPALSARHKNNQFEIQQKVIIQIKYKIIISEGLLT
jgi:hypothetical protein